MKIKLTLRRSGAPDVDLIATLDASATVGDLAEHLSRVDPVPPPAASRAGAGGTTLRLLTSASTVVDPRLKVSDSGLRSGMTVDVTRTGNSYDTSRGNTVAVVMVTAGPDAGTEFQLRAGTSVIGRDRGCEVQLSDPLVSRRHAQITIGAVAEIVDLGSANGLMMGDSSVSRYALRPGDTVRLGDTELSVRVAPVAGTGGEGAGEGFVRSPRLDPRYEGTEFKAPEPPKRPQTARFPYIALLTPMLLGGLLYLLTRAATSLVFVALSPLMMLGYAVEARLAGRSAYKRALRQFRADVEELTASARAAAQAEVVARNREHPPLAECVDAIRRGTPLLWARRPDDPGFLELRLGVGRQPSRSSMALPDGRDLPRDMVAELTAIADTFATVDGVPVIAGTGDHGAVGLAGPRQTVLGAARALVIQTVALHSPAEVVLVGFASSQSARDWDWLKWLPHTTSVHSPLAKRQLAAAVKDCTALISGLEDLLAQRAADDDARVLPAVFVLVEDDAPVERSRLVQLAERGWRHGIHVLWLAADTTLLPAACRTFVTLREDPAAGVAGFVHSGELVAPLAVELLDAPSALELARRLSPLVDTGALIDDDSDLPRTVSLLAVADNDCPLSASAEVVVERWLANRSILTGPYAPPEPAKKAGTLRAVIGRSALGPHALDLRADGPHALVGGTTGAGKSELLQSWILAMAAAHSPQRLTFLLIDYKGGSAFKDLEELPHNVGLFTDLDPHEVRRALTSLYAELRRREELFKELRAKDLVELEKRGSLHAPPSLVIVVDEFAALVNELPEFVDGMINVAQRGRSLGVHLILATQRPAGVIKDNLRANTNLRLALRTADEADSIDVLGTPEAAFFDSRLPGRAVSKTGPGRLVPFQTGYAGGWTTDEPEPPEIVVEELTFGAGKVWEAESDAEQSPADRGATDIERMVTAIEEARRRAKIRLPRKPWLPPLREVYNLADGAQVPNPRRDNELVFGVRDAPEDQEQPTVAFRPDVDGNLAVYGTGGSGKTTLLRTLAVAAGFTVRGGPCHVYGLDFGARGLAMLEWLPHVGSIIAGSDQERVGRLLTWLSELIADRAKRYADAGAGTITEYRTTSDAAANEPRILLLVDGVAAFRQAYDIGERGRLFELFCAIATDGRPVGIHVLLTADRPASVPSALASAVQTRVVLRMADANEYSAMNLPGDVLKPSSPPGRGLLNGAEIQVAMLGEATDLGGQTVNMKGFAATMRRVGAPSAPAIQKLSSRVPIDTLPPAVDGLPVLGVSGRTLAPQTYEPEGTFLIAGPPGAGRSAALRAIAVSLRRWNPRMRMHYFGNRKSRLATLDLWTTRARGPAEAAELAQTLTGDILQSPPEQPVAVFIENIADFVYSPAEAALTELAKVCVTEELFLVAEGETTTLSANMGLIGQAKFNRTGLAFAPDSNDGQVYRANFPPRLNRADFPPGRGLFFNGGRTTVVQVGWVEEG